MGDVSPLTPRHHRGCIRLASLAYIGDLPMIENLLVRNNPITPSTYCLWVRPSRVFPVFIRQQPTARRFYFTNLPCLWSIYSSRPMSWPTLANAPLVASYRRYPSRRPAFSSSAAPAAPRVSFPSFPGASPVSPRPQLSPMTGLHRSLERSWR
jgi:hypothetical protein